MIGSFLEQGSAAHFFKNTCLISDPDFSCKGIGYRGCIGSKAIGNGLGSKGAFCAIEHGWIGLDTRSTGWDHAGDGGRDIKTQVRIDDDIGGINGRIFSAMLDVGGCIDNLFEIDRKSSDTDAGYLRTRYRIGAQ